MKIKLNEDDNNLYCLYSKEPILIGQKYVEVIDYYLGEEIVKTYSLDNAPEYYEDDDLYIN